MSVSVILMSYIVDKHRTELISKNAGTFRKRDSSSRVQLCCSVLMDSWRLGQPPRLLVEFLVLAEILQQGEHVAKIQAADVLNTSDLCSTALFDNYGH